MADRQHEIRVTGDWTEETYPATITEGETWNGWLSPAFDRDTANRVVDDQKELGDEDDRLRWEQRPNDKGDLVDVVIIWNDGYPGEEEVIRPSKEGRYSIGGWRWTWYEAEDRADEYNETERPPCPECGAPSTYSATERVFTCTACGWWFAGIKPEQDAASR